MGLKKSWKRALQLYERAAAQGHARAQTFTGLRYEHGQGVKINYKAAALWYRRAADQEFPDAESNLGTMFYNGKGAPQSYEEAVRWFRLAVAQGEPNALFRLGTCYGQGRGVPRNTRKALRSPSALRHKGTPVPRWSAKGSRRVPRPLQPCRRRAPRHDRRRGRRSQRGLPAHSARCATALGVATVARRLRRGSSRCGAAATASRRGPHRRRGDVDASLAAMHHCHPTAD
mmetsp:Transcript_31799/g.111934  ORF Transcript_31799/g.111934 Transcript_31799/m.111934 type:complete len:230 (-) Transcript_31799:27-716(-)